MNLSNLNILFDKYFRKSYNLDVYVTGTLNKMVCNVLVFPDKFLKRGEDYSEKYWNIVAYNEVLIKALNKFFDMIGVSIRYDRAWTNIDIVKTNNIFNVKYVVSDNLGEYMNDYIEKYFELMAMFPKSDYLPEKYRQDINEPDYVFTLGNIYLVPGEEYEENWSPHLSVDFETNMNPVLLNMLAHDETTVYQFKDFMSNNMELDPQIKFFKIVTGGVVSL